MREGEGDEGGMRGGWGQQRHTSCRYLSNFASGWWSWTPEFAKRAGLQKSEMYTSAILGRVVAMSAFLAAGALIGRVGAHQMLLAALVGTTAMCAIPAHPRDSRFKGLNAKPSDQVPAKPSNQVPAKPSATESSHTQPHTQPLQVGRAVLLHAGCSPSR